MHVTPPVLPSPPPIASSPIDPTELANYLEHQRTHPLPTPPPHQSAPPSPAYKTHLPPWAQSSPVYNALPLTNLVNIVGKPLPDPTIDDSDIFETSTPPPTLPPPTLPTIAKPHDNVVIIQINGVPCRLNPNTPIYTSAELLQELWQSFSNARILPFDTPHPFQLSRFPCWMNPKPKNVSSFTFHIIDDAQSTQALKIFYNQQLVYLFNKPVKVVLPDF
ncbi:hypothetical protein WOLCODRAFT_150242 [Wolfiporia cocos MD-104 SS10]|uniref:Uncharacterized protein n=1 Tax=Wolfiporia cocos (strain MD-104) TaxID=742152 RepID=A0A2H3JE81_WOLCO|nr:hypothetical protein WOLCODRAFT_150242 [Wolfiporia cocos MD-104 SS10]